MESFVRANSCEVRGQATQNGLNEVRACSREAAKGRKARSSARLASLGLHRPVEDTPDRIKSHSCVSLL